MKPMISSRDGNHNVLDGFGYSNYVDARVLAGTVAEVITVPTGAKKVLFSGTGNYYVRFGAAAAIPAVDVTDGSGSCLNPALREIDGAATIGIIAPNDCVVTLEFFA
jgi:hypothetical protein